MHLGIRHARRSDAARLSRIAHAAKRHWDYPAALIRLWRGDLTVSPAMAARQPVYCAVRGRTVVGFYALSGRGRTREVEHMWVDPRYIGCGVGTLLFTHLRSRLRAMHVTRLKIASDPNAVGFYKRMGARRVGKIPSLPSGRWLPLLTIDLPPKLTNSHSRTNGWG